MNEYVYDMMNEVELTDEEMNLVVANRKIAKRNRTYLDSQIWMFDTLDIEL